jgi:hypothetical protein
VNILINYDFFSIELGYGSDLYVDDSDEERLTKMKDLEREKILLERIEKRNILLERYEMFKKARMQKDKQIL